MTISAICAAVATVLTCKMAIKIWGDFKTAISKSKYSLVASQERRNRQITVSVSAASNKLFQRKLLFWDSLFAFGVSCFWWSQEHFKFWGFYSVFWPFLSSSFLHQDCIPIATQTKKRKLNTVFRGFKELKQFGHTWSNWWRLYEPYICNLYTFFLCLASGTWAVFSLLYLIKSLCLRPLRIYDSLWKNKYFEISQ